ncbi:MAG: hypothetical protein KDK97_12585, partial [Verrucomicrobiales bacterium]|nr:hypothetical protein [Verrucomicrobiales bacterium]
MSSGAYSRRGFTSAELLLVLALSAIIIGGAVMSLGTISRAQPRSATFVDVPLGSATMQNFYGFSASTIRVAVAPQYGVMAQAEKLREQFLNDVASSTAVFCLARGNGVLNPFHRVYIPFSMATDGWIDSPEAFVKFLRALDPVNNAFTYPFRNPTNEVPTALPPNCSIYLLSFSKFSTHIKVQAIYDVDVIKFASNNPSSLSGFFASVRRYSDNPDATVDDPSNAGTAEAVYAGGYDIFYPPSYDGTPLTTTLWNKDNFAPLFVTFERDVRAALRENAYIDRFKLAREMPFYFVWWPDPGAANLGPVPN